MTEKNNGVSKSASTLQLLGQLDNVNYGKKSLRNFKVSNDSAGDDEDGRRKRSPTDSMEYSMEDETEVLVNVSKAVLSTIQLLRRIITEYAYGRMGRELQHVSLTVASFERVLYKFIRDEVIFLGNDRSDSDVTISPSGALKDIVPLISKNSRHTVLGGGAASLLRHSSLALEDMNKVLLELQLSYDPKYEKRLSFRSILGFIGFLIAARHWSIHRSLRSLFKRYRPSYGTLKWGVVAFVMMDYWNRFRYRFSNLRKIKISHSRVLLTLRLFLLCQYVLQRAQLTRTSSQRLLIGNPIEADIDDNKKNATALLVERVPLPEEYYKFETNALGLTLFQTGSNVLLASSGLANYLVGKQKQLWKLVMLCAIPFYALRPDKASRYATRLLIDQPDVDVIRHAWYLFGESSLSKWLLLLQVPKIPVRRQIFLDDQTQVSRENRCEESDISVFLFSSRSLKNVRMGTWEDGTKSTCSLNSLKVLGLPKKRNILFYVHGGGFFGRFIAQDMYNLTMWAIKLGAVIVYPDYGLAPETQYPKSLDQCFAVYKWVLDGGLGFTPDKITMFGESAGGNILAAMCIKIIKAKIRPADGVLLMFPALNMHLSPSPSRFLHQSDPLLPRGVLELALNSYNPAHGTESSRQYTHNIHDPLVSPGAADDTYLCQFPPTHLVVGGLDPLLDDSIDFNTRLRQNGVSSTLKVFPHLTHSFLIYGGLVKEAQKAIDYSCDVLHEILQL